MRLGSILTAIAVVCLSGHAKADTIVSHLNGNYAGVAITGASSNGGYGAVASAFVSPGNYQLNTVAVDVSMAYGFGGSNENFDEYLYADDGGAPGAMVATLATGLTAPSGFAVVAEVDATSPAVDLTQGTEYWLVLAPADNNSTLEWEFGGGLQTQAVSENHGSGWSSNGLLQNQDFALYGTPLSATPEPSGLALLGTGALGIAGVVRRRMRASA